MLRGAYRGHGKAPRKYEDTKMQRKNRIARASRLTLTKLLIAAGLAAAGANAQTGKDQPFYKVKPAASVANTEPTAAPSVSQQYEKEGMVVEFSMTALERDSGKDPGLVAGADATVSFRLTDKQTGQPIRGLRPNAWLSGRAAEHAPNEAECKDEIRAFMGGRLSTRADIDLNSYSMLTLNHDNTITFINPQI